MNKFIENLHTVPINEVLTVNTIVFILVAIIIAKFLKLGWKATLLLIILFILIDIFANPFLNIPNNLSYYFGQGKRPIGWRYA